MKAAIVSLALLLGAAAIPAYQQSAGQDMKDAGTETKNAAKSAGRAAKKGATKSTHAVKKGANKAATKVSDKTH
ncbi:MAG: hypothetical protein JOY62_17770 [Acidobacteriaceae bacterium]|nr:hypothetical protein [Acidobacteriaceae bacterium]MBV9781816.1 hypothetical protein [Acidobacteriaceae bacterium]